MGAVHGNRTLYRPVGLRELQLILDSDACAFPPRLPEQPIFYPVLNFEYAEQIARDWNTTDAGSGFAGLVTEFAVAEEFLAHFEVRTVGAARHQELWVPADMLSDFNAHLRGPIRSTHAYYGSNYKGPEPRPLCMREKEPSKQLKAFAAIHSYNGMDFVLETTAGNWQLVYCNYGFWSASMPESQGLSASDAERVLQAMDKVWVELRPELPLPVGRLSGM